MRAICSSEMMANSLPLQYPKTRLASPLENCESWKLVTSYDTIHLNLDSE
jgi:hypothetical protein